MAINAFPKHAGKKFTNGFIGPSGPRHGSNFYVMDYKWMSGDVTDNTWASWIKPQIDAWKAIGGNCISIIFSSTLLYGTQGTVTTAQFDAAVRQIAEYLDSQDMYFFPVLSQGYEYSQFGIGATEYAAYLSHAAGQTVLYPRTIGMDVISEVDLASNHADVLGSADTWMGWAAAGMVARPVPMTCSVAAYDFLWSRGQAIIDKGADFAAYNWFNTSFSIGDLEPLVFNAGSGASGITDKAVVTASMGIDFGAHPSGAAAFMGMMKDWLDHARVQMITLWIITDYASATLLEYYGAYDNTQNGSYVFTSPRTAMTAVIATWATAPKAYASSEDAHATLAAAPTVAALNTSATFSISAASGPGGTVTYTGQYVKRTTTGCPDLVNDDWHDGTSTTGTSLAVSGLTQSRRYLARVKVATDDGGITYSAWTPFVTQGKEIPVGLSESPAVVTQARVAETDRAGLSDAARVRVLQQSAESDRVALTETARYVAVIHGRESS